MQINKIILQNWRSHKQTSLEFSKGTNVFVGIMGSGKSSVLDAVTYALFGRFPKNDRKEVKLPNVLRFGSQKGTVELWFSISNKQYKIIREIGSDLAEIYVEDSGSFKLLQKDKKRVTSVAESLLGVDYSVFIRSVYAEQNNLDYFLSLPPSKRKEELDDLLGINKFYSVLSNTSKIIHRVEIRVKDLSMNYSEEAIDNLKKEITSIEQSLDELDKSIAVLNKEKNSYTSKHTIYKKEFDEIEKNRTLYENLNKNLMNLAGKIESLESQNKKSDFSEEEYKNLKNQILDLEKEVEKLKQTRKNFLDVLNNLIEKISDFSSKLSRAKDLEEKIKKIKDENVKLVGNSSLQDLKSELKSKETRIQDAKSQHISKKAKIEELKKLSTEIDPNMAKCPLCGSNLTEDHIYALLSEREVELSKLKNELNELSQTTDSLSSDSNSLKDKIMLIEKNLSVIKSLDSEKIDLEDLKQNLDTLNLKKKEISQEISNLDNQLSTLFEKEKELLSKAKDFENAINILKSLDESSKKYNEIKTEITNLNYNEKVYMSAHDRLKTIDKEIEKIDIELKGFKNLSTEKRSGLDNYKKEFDNLTKVKKRLEKYGTKITELKKFRNAMEQTIIELRNYIINALNVAVEELWPHIYPYRDFDSIKIQISEKDYNLMIHVKERDWLEISQIASGGERMCAALVFRIALAIVLTPELGWLVLDEPTHNMDSEAVELMALMLEEKIPGIISQTFIISHDETLLRRNYDRVYLFKRDKENREPTIVERIN
ncbi:AAA family ATPase [Candidatus Micrarchaeota archaeon]|nr:AAA family ATPase [Candidatus Micrarchaeota archaeon]